MSKEDIPTTVRSLLQKKDFRPDISSSAPQIVDRLEEAKRVVARIQNIVDEHREACLPLGVKLSLSELRIVFSGLRGHARGGQGALNLGDRDEVEAHCLNRLFEELVEEPSNILYVTNTGPDSKRYDAMDSIFWIDCLDLLEKELTENEESKP